MSAIEAQIYLGTLKAFKWGSIKKRVLQIVLHRCSPGKWSLIPSPLSADWLNDYLP